MQPSDRYESELGSVRDMAQEASLTGELKHIGMLEVAAAIDEIFGHVLMATNPGADPKLLPIVRGRLVLARMQFKLSDKGGPLSSKDLHSECHPDTEPPTIA